VHAALNKLNAAGMKKLLLDLRNNPGGLVARATAVADEFLPSDKLIVYTEGKPGTRENTYAKTGGLFEKGKMVVLVNENTASASEILTGALQDNQRAVVIGNRTFGKGLVQKIIALSDSSTALKLTIAKYYTPSGKCIQQPYTGSGYIYTRKNENLYAGNEAVPDSLKKTALADWGITPDIFIESDTTAAQNFFTELNLRSYISQAACVYYANNTSYFSSFKNFNDFAVHYEPGDDRFSRLKQQVLKWNSSPGNYFPSLTYTDRDFDRTKTKIKLAFKAYIAQEQWGDDGYFPLINSIDEDIQEAIKVLQR
jgi:carboxyl-terminal processing protease